MTVYSNCDRAIIESETAAATAPHPHTVLVLVIVSHPRPLTSDLICTLCFDVSTVYIKETFASAYAEFPRASFPSLLLCRKDVDSVSLAPLVFALTPAVFALAPAVFSLAPLIFALAHPIFATQVPVFPPTF